MSGLDVTNGNGGDLTRYTFTRDELASAIACCRANVTTSGPAAGMILAESMADAIIKAHRATAGPDEEPQR